MGVHAFKVGLRLGRYSDLCRDLIGRSVSETFDQKGEIMGRGRISFLIPGTVLAAFTCIMAGLEAYPQSQRNATDSESQVRENLKNAEVQYRLGREDSEFATVIDLFKNDLIDADLADAVGCPQMTSAKGKTCPGTHAPLRGYLYRLEAVRSAADWTAGFRVIGVPAVAKGETQTGTCTFYVDQTAVIRASDDPTVVAGPLSPPLGTPQAPVIW
jgi:hypothetical protein